MALEVLHDVLTSRRHRTWSNTHELIMKKYIDLCILLKKVSFPRLSPYHSLPLPVLLPYTLLLCVRIS